NVRFSLIRITTCWIGHRVCAGTIRVPEGDSAAVDVGPGRAPPVRPDARTAITATVATRSTATNSANGPRARPAREGGFGCSMAGVYAQRATVTSGPRGSDPGSPGPPGRTSPVRR